MYYSSSDEEKKPKILISNSVKTNVKFVLKNIFIYTEIRTRDSAPVPGVLLFTESLECDKECLFFLVSLPANRKYFSIISEKFLA